MRPSAQRAVAWFDRRTGLRAIAREILNERIPASAGWPHVFGSVALFLFAVQAATGVLLAINFVPTPEEAHDSLTYIIRNVAFGSTIRGLHHWGASLMLIVVVLHMTQVFLYGAYKRPREMTWTVGGVLLLVTLAFGLTGYLLPGDNRAYWGTLVTTRIAGQVPFIGDYLQHLMGADDGIGALTFSRFYALHVMVLPISAVVLVVLHVYLVRRHGVAPKPADSRPDRSFYPDQAFRDTVAVFIAFAFLFLAAMFLRVPLERLADPADSHYIPRPEWYFLFLFEVLTFLRGPLETIGSVGLPTLAVAALFAVPFVDRSKMRLLRQRTVAISIVIFSASGWTALTIAAVQSTPGMANAHSGSASQGTLIGLSAEQTAGYGYFRELGCASCHNLVEGDPKPAPNLTGVASEQTPEWIGEHLEEMRSRTAGAGSIAHSLLKSNALWTLLKKLTPETESGLQDIPQSLIEGSEIYIESGCASCHSINGTGGEVAPALNGVGARRTKEWIDQHFLNPNKLSPGSMMPRYRFAPDKLKVLDDYLLSLE